MSNTGLVPRARSHAPDRRNDAKGFDSISDDEAALEGLASVPSDVGVATLASASASASARVGLAERGRIERSPPNGKEPNRQDLEVVHAS